MTRKVPEGWVSGVSGSYVVKQSTPIGYSVKQNTWRVVEAFLQEMDAVPQALIPLVLASGAPFSHRGVCYAAGPLMFNNVVVPYLSMRLEAQDA